MESFAECTDVSIVSRVSTPGALHTVEQCVDPAIQIQTNPDAIKVNTKATTGHLGTFQFRQCYFSP